MPAEVSDEEIAREYQTLRNLRRRSASSPGPGALAIDPDLPPPSPNARPSYSPEASTSYSSDDDITLSTLDGLDGDKAGLFWVPAHLHPELAPGEFRAFLKAHTLPDPEHADGSDADDADGLSRSSSWLSRNGSRRGSDVLGRKRSMLSRQYQPKAGDQVENERPPMPNRQRASIYGGRTGEKGLTLEDLQKLEIIVDEAGETDDPADMRKLLRRSLSMNVAPGFLQDDEPHGEDGDTPLIAGGPSSILRRSARTKIRKSSLIGDGGDHRFAATRKGRMTAAPVIDIPGLEDDDEYSRTRRSDPSDESEEGFKDSSVDSHEEQKFHDAPQHIDDYERRPSDASTDEAVIFDAYARESRSCSTSSDSRTPSQTPSPEPSPPLDQQSSIPPLLPPMPRSGSYGQEWFKEEGDRTPTQESLTDPLAGLRRPSPGDEYGETRPRAPSRPGGMTLQIPTDLVGASPPSPSTTHQSPGALSPSQYELPPGMAPPAPRSAIPPGIALQQQRGQELVPPVPLDVTRPTMVRSESGTSTASSQKEKEKEKEKKGGFFSKKKEKEKKSKEKDGFLGSLFSGKKKPEETSSIANFSSAGPAAAAALLGSSKSAKSLGLSPVPSPTSPGFNSFARYPIHVERAVYRLSHIKLANARRPLYEQVLISNLMFWYLGVIGRNVADEKKPNGSEEKQEEVKPAVRGTPPKASDSGIAGTIPSPKKTGLTKPDRSRGGRDNEAPVRTPSYGMQNALVDNELRNANVSISMKVPPRAQPQQIPQQHPSHHQQPLHQHISSIQTQSPQQIPGFTSQQRSGPVPPQPTRAFSSPVPAPLQRPMSDAYPNQAHMVHRDIQPPPRGPPQSSFGPPPPVMGQASQSQPILDGRDLRQRTLSNPPPGHPPPPNHAGMRRVVTDGRSPYPPPDGRDRTPSSPHGQHVGPQPGQIFAYPGAAPQPGHPFPSRPSPSPGHVFNGPQPGQAFHHPYPHPHGPFNGQRPPFDQNRPPPGHQQQWDAPIGLPPGASPGPGDQQYLGPPGQPHRRGPSPPTDQYDPRREQLPFSLPSPQQGGPPPLGIPNSHSSGPGFYPPAGVASIQPGQLFNPYAVRPMPARHTSGDDMYRTVQTVPGNQYGPHHR